MQAPSTAEDLAQAAVEVGVVTDAQVASAWNDLGTTGVTLEAFAQAMMRKDLLTSYQLDRLQRGLRDGYVYGDYVMLYCVGAGTFARVFRAVNRDTGQIFAIKVLRARHNSTQLADFFRREGELGKKLIHPNIVPIREVVSQRGIHYLVMDFIEGQNLRDLHKIRQKLDWQTATRITVDILSGLHYAFGHGVTHRDLKMSNVLIESDGTAKLIDFGLAALDGASGDEGVDRTVEYAALEKATGVRKDDDRSDIFFTGCMLHRMLTGISSLPEGKNRASRFSKEVFRDIKPVRDLAPETPMPLALVLSRSLEFDPEKRYQTPGDMLSELKLAIRRSKGGEATGGQRDSSQLEGYDADGKQRRVMVVESDTKRQDVLRELFKRNGYRVLVASDGDRACSRFHSDPAAADVVLFCGATLGKNAVESFNQFAEERGTAGVPALLLLEEAQGEWARAANTSDHRGVIVMPVKLRRLREAVLASLRAAQSAKA